MANCENCSRVPAPVDFQTHQADMARLERTNIRLGRSVVCLTVVCIALVIALILNARAANKALLDNNEKWINMWMEYDIESYEYQQDGEGVNIIGDRNGVDYYWADGESTEADPEGEEIQR